MVDHSTCQTVELVYHQLIKLIFTHAVDIDDFIEGLDGVLEDRLDGLHDTESALHKFNLRLHAFDCLLLSGDLNERLAVIESLEDSCSESLLESLYGSGLRDGGICLLGLKQIFLNIKMKLILIHGLISSIFLRSWDSSIWC